MSAEEPREAAPALLVPVSVQALVVTHNSWSDVWSWTPPSYPLLAWFEPTDPLPFTRLKPQIDSRDFTGVVLHWALPDGLTGGSQRDAGGEIRYPAIPNRWLIVRRSVDPADPARWSFDCSIVASDWLGDRQGSPYPNAQGSGRTYLGRSWPLALWPGEAEARRHALPEPLTAVGPGDATFAAFAPNVKNVVSVLDQLGGAGKGPVSYAVYGWYGDPGTDPLFGAASSGPLGWRTFDQWRELMAGLAWAPGEGGPDLARATDAAAAWASDHGQVSDPEVPRSRFPARILCHGMITDVAWLGADGPHFTGVPTSDPQRASFIRPVIAIGNSPADALSALLGDALAERVAPHSPAQVASALAAFQAGLLPDLAAPDGQARVDAGLQAGWFGSVPGGIAWQVVAPEAPGEPAGHQSPPELTPEQAELLAQLGARQRALDERQQALAALQAEVDTLWWKQEYLVHHPDLPWEGLVSAAASRARERCLAAIGEYRWLRQQRDTCLVALTVLLGDLLLKSEVAGTFYRPNEPVLLISGAQRAFRHGEDRVFSDDGRLACRFTGQAIAGIAVRSDGQEYVVRGGQVPLPPLPPLAAADLPPELADLVVEAMYLDGSVAPAIAAAARPADPWLLLGPIRRAQNVIWNPALHPALNPGIVAEGSGLLTQYGLGAMPDRTGVALWSPPWAPLYLDWRVEYRPATEAAGRRLRDWAPPADSATPGPGDWSYRWTGTEPGPRIATIEGRTLLTPQAPEQLAARIEQVIVGAAANPGLAASTWALRDALDYLRTSDLLCQSLSGFGLGLLQRSPEAFRAAAPDSSLPPFLRPSGAPRFVPSSRPVPDASPVAFSPLRAGHLKLRDLWVVDDFGQAFLVFGAIGIPAVRYEPVLSPDLVTPDFPTFAMLRPRVSQLARLDLSLLDAGRDDQQTGQVPGATPLCGWLLGHPLERAVLVYDAAGELAGELLLGDSGVIWWPPPERAAPPRPGERAGLEYLGRHLRGIVTGVLDHPDPKAALGELLALLADAGHATGPGTGPWLAEELPVPIGQPLAVIRARLAYRLNGPAASSELWADTGKDVTGGFEDIVLPVQLGSTELLDDAVVGWYLNDDYRSVLSVYASGHAGAGPRASGYVRQGRAELTLRGGAAQATMITVPHAAIHAVTGLLPVLRQVVPPDLLTPALRAIAVTLRTGPVVSDTAATVLPLPLTGVPWSWLQYTDTRSRAGEYPVALADATARLPDVAPVIREGWLKMVPGGQSAVFGYAVTPGTVACTTDPDRPVVAALQVTAYNGTPDPVACTELRFALAVGPGERDLTERPETISAQPGSDTPWSAGYDDDGTVIAVPDGGLAVPPGAVLVFVISGVQVSPVAGVAVIEITETADGEPRTALIAVSKTSPP
ncbi:MAG TPA: hypothetical protein VGG25_19655 [Streptosporangiaceae bacterium]